MAPARKSETIPIKLCCHTLCISRKKEFEISRSVFGNRSHSSNTHWKFQQIKRKTKICCLDHNGIPADEIALIEFKTRFAGFSPLSWQNILQAKYHFRWRVRSLVRSLACLHTYLPTLAPFRSLSLSLSPVSSRFQRIPIAENTFTRFSCNNTHWMNRTPLQHLKSS